jgi:hypothetical protein
VLAIFKYEQVKRRFDVEFYAQEVKVSVVVLAGIPLQVVLVVFAANRKAEHPLTP